MSYTTHNMQSSAIAQVCYFNDPAGDQDYTRAFIRFTSGKVYQYDDVPVLEVRRLAMTPKGQSAGKRFANLRKLPEWRGTPVSEDQLPRSMRESFDPDTARAHGPQTLGTLRERLRAQVSGCFNAGGYAF